MNRGWRRLTGVLALCVCLAPAPALAETDSAADAARLEKIEQRVLERLPTDRRDTPQFRGRSHWASRTDENGRGGEQRMPVTILLAADLYGPMMVAARNVSNAARFEGRALKTEEPPEDAGTRARAFWERRHEAYRADQAARLAQVRELAVEKAAEIPFWRRQLENVELRGPRHERWIAMQQEHLDRFEAFLESLPDDDEKLEEMLIERADSLRDLLQSGEGHSRRAQSREQRTERLRTEITHLRSQLARLESELEQLEAEEDWGPVLEMTPPEEEAANEGAGTRLAPHAR